MGGKHLKNWRFRCLTSVFPLKKPRGFVSLVDIDGIDSVGCSKEKHVLLFHHQIWLFDTQSYHFTTLFRSFSYPKPGGRTFILFLARTSSPKGLIPKRILPENSSSQFGIHPEAIAELNKLEEKEKAKAEMRRRGTWDWNFWCSPKVPGFKKGGVFLSRWKESCGFWRSAESRNELIHMLRSFKNHYIFIYTHLNVGSKVLWTFLSAFFGGEFRLWGGLFPNIPSSTYKRWPAIAFQVQQQIGEFIPNWDEMKLQF